MNTLLSMGWLGKSVLGAICSIPLILVFNFFTKNYGIKPEVVMSLHCLGIFLGIALASYFGLSGASVKDFYNPIIPAISIVVLGSLIGATTNILLAQAISSAPNPALPFAIGGIATVSAYLLAPLLAFLLPDFFSAAEFNWLNFLGILLIVAGLGLIMYK